MKTNGTTDRRAARRFALGNQRGMLLVITMIIMLVVSTLAAANLIDAFLERSIARNQNNSSVALNAAEAGINDALAWLNDSTNLATIPTTANPWTRPGDPVTRTLASGATYNVTISFKGDNDALRPDQDCDGNATAADIVYFNKGAFTSFSPAWTPRACPHDGQFPYKGAIFTGAAGDAGFPVITIRSQGYLGTAASNRAYREIWMDVARNKLAAQVEGAFTARAGVSASGASQTDGRNYDLAGNPVGGGVGCMADKPGITYDSGVVPSETCPNANILGNPCVATYDPLTSVSGEPIQKTPWGTLGITQTDFGDMFTEKSNNQLDMTDCAERQYVWFSADNTENASGVGFNSSSPCSTYSGILVVHNVNFDPDQWEARCGVGSTDAYCSADADGDGNRDNAPAVFDMNGSVTWVGIVIADQVVKVNGNPTIRGGVISLASGGVIDNSDITGSITIQYSCEAVTGSTNQGYKTRLGWHRIR